MDVTRYLELKVGPRAIFDDLPDRLNRPRYMIPQADGAWRAITYGEIAKHIEHAALFLRTVGVGKGDRVAIFAPNRVEWMSAAIAIQSIGAVMVPIYPSSTAEQAAYVVKHCEARVLFADTPSIVQRVLASFAEYESVERVVVFEDDVLKSVPAAHERKFCGWSAAQKIGAARAKEDPKAFMRELDAVQLDDIGMMLYTSGTSGPPKGVPLTHRNIAINGRDWLQSNARLLDEGAIDLLWLPMSHIFGFGEASVGNALGFVTYMSDPLTVVKRLPEVRPNVLMSVPSVWEKLAAQVVTEPDPAKRRARLAEITGGRLRFCLSGGAGLKREVKELFHASGILIIEGYGLTETSPTLTLNRPDAFRFDTVGKPFPSVEIKLAEDGEIWAKGPSVFKGYFKDEAATKNAFTDDGWFKTGDLGRFTDDGFLQIIGRKKDILVTSGGKNIAPENIELKFRDDPAIASVVVYGDGHRYLVAGVWLNDRSLSTEAIQARIDRVNQELASCETIKKFAIMDRPLTVEDGFLTATLKVRRAKIYDAFRDRFEALYD
jgi:long-chain acyl-CoA synthetase